MELDRNARGVLRKMYDYGYIGGKHTAVDNLQKSFPKDERGNVKVSVKFLIRMDLIIPKPTGYGMHCSLNPRRLEDIEKLIEDDEENDD